MLKVCVETYGCTLNQADSDILSALLKEKYVLTDGPDGADVIILNTCTVKGVTENKILEYVRHLGRENRKFVVAGCLTANEAKIRKFAPLAPMVGTSSLDRICDAVGDALAGRATAYTAPASKESLPKLLAAPIMRIPINDGCTSSCAFCQTKLARPFLRSYSPKTIVRWINESVRSGAREIQLTSMDSGAYGLDLRTNLVELMEAIANDDSASKSPLPFLVRVGMINPNHAKRMLPGIIRLLKGPRFYRFLHIPVQTGSEKVCRDMNRDHTVEDFVDIVKAVRNELPDATIATDIIAGYPTETEKDFEDTVRLLETVRPDITNVSRFSPRPGTKAKELEQLPNLTVKARSTKLARMVRSISEECKKRYIGTACRVLVTEKQRDFTGRDINYRQVVVKGFRGALGDFIYVEITGANHGSLFGRIIR
jgi:threonylcarbamoyladenosine tRNA methylthiotransferase CDKAL1